MKQLSWFLLLLALALCFAEDKFATVNGEITLSPGSATIKSVVWKVGTSKVAEYDPTFDDATTFYRSYVGRTKLNTQTGSITISKLTTEDAGEYSVEIDNVVTATKFNLKVIEALKSVTITTDDPKKCVLFCKVEPSSYEKPLNYQWTENGENGQSLGHESQLSVEHTARSKFYTCNASNPVSWKAETAKAEDICTDVPVPQIIGALFGALAVVGIVVVGLFLYREHKGGKRDDEETRNNSGSDRNKDSNGRSGVI